MTDSELLELAAKDEVIAEAGEMLAMRDRQLAALKAENEELRKDAEWRYIETAPKDGTVIMVAEETEPGFWEYEQGFYSHTWGFGGGSCTNNPTHWMPLPKPPAMAKMRKEMK